jgi:hypothetical protein
LRTEFEGTDTLNSSRLISVTVEDEIEEANGTASQFDCGVG